MASAKRTRKSRLPSPADIAADADAGGDAGETRDAPAAVFVRAIDLPTASLRQARAAVAQQLDILSPLPPAGAAWSVVLLGPTEEGLSRFAVGFAPLTLLAQRAPDGTAVRLVGQLDGQDLEFRFDRAGSAGTGKLTPGARLEIATIAGLCLAVVLAGANLRVDREIDGVQARLDAADTLVQQRAHEAAASARVLGAWRAAAASRKAGVVDCALGDLAKAGGGPMKLAKLTLTDGQVTAWLSAPAPDAAISGLRALGVQPVATTATAAAAPAAPGADPAAATPVVQQFQIGQAACA
jgi:hypothetical protein